MDKVGNFIGWLYIDGVNLFVFLVEYVFFKVYFIVECSFYYKFLLFVEEVVKQKKEKVWVYYEEQFVEEVMLVLEEKE